MYMERVSVTDRANVIIDQLRERHGDLIFHQSDCCDGSLPRVLQGRGSGFSLEIPLGLRFMAISRLPTDDELVNVRPIET